MRVSIRRRKSPTYWSAEQLDDQVRAVYRAPIRETGDFETRGGTVAALVFHQDPALLPRKMVRIAERENDGFVPYAMYGFWWSDYLIGCVNVGDEPFDTFRAYSGHHTEAEARQAARDFVASEGVGAPADAAFADLEAQGFARYMLRRGPGYFMGQY